MLANLVAEFTECPKKVTAEENEVIGAQVIVVTIPYQPVRKLYVNGAANQKGLCVGIVLVSPKKITIEKSLRSGFLAANNKDEYEALLVRIIRPSMKSS